MGTMRTPSPACDVCWDTGVSPRRARLYVGPPFGRYEGPHHLDDAAHVGQQPGAVHGALVLAGDLVELEGGFHAVAVADGSALIDEGLVAPSP